MSLLIAWCVLAAALWVCTRVLDGMKIEGGIAGYLIVALILALLDFFLGWLLFVAIGIMSLGLGFVFQLLTRWFVYACLLKLADALTPRLTVRSFGVALIAAALISLIKSGADRVLAALL